MKFTYAIVLAAAWTVVVGNIAYFRGLHDGVPQGSKIRQELKVTGESLQSCMEGLKRAGLRNAQYRWKFGELEMRTK